MVTLMTRQRVNPDRLGDYLAIQRRLWRLTHAHEADTVLRYEHYRAEEPYVFVSLLSFRSYEDFLNHQVADYHHDVDWDGIFAEITLQWVDPLEGANALERTDPTLAGKLDAKRKVYADMMLAKRPAWWDQA